jgi:hypothetical protein
MPFGERRFLALIGLPPATAEPATSDAHITAALSFPITFCWNLQYLSAI